MTVFGDNFFIEGLRLPGLRERVEAFVSGLARRRQAHPHACAQRLFKIFAQCAKGALRSSPAYFAVCCCSDRDFYVGREMPERAPLGPMSCMRCPKFARGCWGPRVEERG